MIGISQPSSILLSYGRFQRNYLWDIFLPDIGVLGGLVGFTLGQLVQSVSFGDYNIDPEEIMKAGPYSLHFAGKLSVEKVKMVFLKPIPDIVTSYFTSWKNMIVGEDGTYYPKNNYQRSIYIRFNDATGLAIGQYQLLGAFPIKFPSYSLEFSSQKIAMVPIEFQIDKVETTLF